MTDKKIENVIIIGSGPAGYTAAIYTARANLEPLLFNGMETGGQLTITTEVENFPGFPESVQGPELMDKMREQATRFGTRFVDDEVTEVDFSQQPFKIVSDDEEYFAHSVIIATGATAKKLNIESEKKYWTRGISACATCDGFFFKGKEIVVIGGGDTAMEEATYLTHFASKVTVIHRREELRASKIMQEKGLNNPKINFAWNSVIEEYTGDDKFLTGVKLRNIKTGEITEFPCEGAFLAIGHKPNTDVFKEWLELDETGYILTENNTVRTKIPGVFAAGDVMDKTYRQAISAAGTGCQAAIEAERYVENVKFEQK